MATGNAEVNGRAEEGNGRWRFRIACGSVSVRFRFRLAVDRSFLFPWGWRPRNMFAHARGGRLETASKYRSSAPHAPAEACEPGQKW
eukprot:859688-Pyramimonas_sp.AAC.1